MKSDKKNSIYILIVIVIVVYCIGIWKQSWEFGWYSIGIALLIIVSYAFTAYRYYEKSIPVVSKDAVNYEISSVYNGQSRRFKHLVYNVSPEWRMEKKDDNMWAANVFFVDSLTMMLRIGIRSTSDHEDTSLAGLQSFAKMHYENLLGGMLTRNEIATFAKHPSLITECRFKNDNYVLRYSFIIHSVEYCVQFTFATEDWFKISLPFINVFERLCYFEFPVLHDYIILKGAVSVGIPNGFIQTENKDKIASWKGEPGPLIIKVSAIETNNEKEAEEILKKLPGFKHKPDYEIIRFRMEDLGLSIYRYGTEKNENWIIDIVHLASGLMVFVETDHLGNINDTFDGYNIETIRRAISASLKDTRIPII